jgi:hypothetical protein
VRPTARQNTRRRSSPVGADRGAIGICCASREAKFADAGIRDIRLIPHQPANAARLVALMDRATLIVNPPASPDSAGDVRVARSLDVS